MAFQMKSELVSNHQNWELSYNHSNQKDLTLFQTVAGLIINGIIWPILSIGNVIILTAKSHSYLKSLYNEKRMIKVLNSEALLVDYSEKRKQSCEKQINRLKVRAVFLMHRLKDPTITNLPVPQKGRSGSKSSPDSPQTGGDNFSWDDFLMADFFQMAGDDLKADKRTLHKLGLVRARLKFLNRQNEVLSNLVSRMESIKKIAEMNLIKNAFIRQEAKESILRSFAGILPFGAALYLRFKSPTDDWVTYNGNKELLPAQSPLDQYADLVEAHNDMVKNNDFLVPHIKKIE